MDELTLLKEIEPVASDLLNRHLGVAKEWFPHEMVPYSRGKDFEPGKQWSENDSDFGADEIEMSDAVRGSLFVNLLTEDNLPYYFRDINSLFGNEGVYGEWGRNCFPNDITIYNLLLDFYVYSSWILILTINK